MNLEFWLAFLLAAFIISISPGVGAVNTMSNGLQYGIRRTLPSILGLQLGYGIQIAVVGIGLGALLASSTLAFEIVKWVGVLYLAWLGYKKWTQPLLPVDSSSKHIESVKKQFWMAAFVNLTNPKVTVFLLALFPQFIDIRVDTQLIQYVVMGGTLIIADIIVMLGYACLASQLSRWMKSERHQVIQNRIFGGMFIGAATLMAGYRSS
jgi:homoserine/homoserine lactone efflux protein